MGEENKILSGKELENRVRKRYKNIKEIPPEHLDFVERHAMETATALNMHLEGSKSKYVLILVERDSYQYGNQYNDDEDPQIIS